MSNITIFLGFDFSNVQGSRATFYKLNTSPSDSPFCDGPQNDKLAAQLLGSPPTGVPLQTFYLNSNKLFSQDNNWDSGNVSAQIGGMTPINGTVLTLTNPCPASCDYYNVANNTVGFINLGFYSHSDTNTNTDHMIMEIYSTNTANPKTVFAILVRECVQGNVPVDYITAWIRGQNPLTVQDILSAARIEISFYATDLMVKSSPASMYCCQASGHLTPAFPPGPPQPSPYQPPFPPGPPQPSPQPYQPYQPLQPGMQPLQPSIQPLQPSMQPLQPGMQPIHAGMQPNMQSYMAEGFTIGTDDRRFVCLSRNTVIFIIIFLVVLLFIYLYWNQKNKTTTIKI